jgi:predicted helicase
MSLFPLKPTHAPVKNYYAALAQFHLHGHDTEGNTRSAFADLLKKCCHPYAWHLVEEYQFKGTARQSLRADGAIVDDLTLVHGLWEAKDSSDDIQAEIKKKVSAGYPLTNILFQSSDRAVLYQDTRIALDCDLTKPENLIEILERFFEHRQPHEVDWEEAVTKFAEKIPDLARGVTTILEAENRKNPAFRENFQSFAVLCRQSINPELTDDAIRKMLVQHLLTARIFIRVFQNEEFLRRNVIAVEIEKVIDSITSRYFSRNEFLKPLDRFYTAIEKAAESQTGYTEKQHFLNAVYEKFFQRFDTKQADTHGIVYTPQPIVDFMVRSVEKILHAEFGKSLSDSGVHILDPFTGTGNFITRIMQQIKRTALPQKYAEELHCNEIMLLPYYIASMNIEHAYMERLGNGEKLGEYRPFEGICLVDTFDTTGQGGLFSTENTKRIRKQIDADIRVVIGNPPYNAGQVRENDRTKNRNYEKDGGIDSRVSRTYAKDSAATLSTKLWDPYVKAFRWATDRIREHGIVCFVSNSSFVHQNSFDGMRKHLSRDYSRLYILDLGGDVRKNPHLSGTTHNVFGIQVGVSICILIRHPKNDTQVPARILYACVPRDWIRSQKFDQLNEWESTAGIGWTELAANSRHTWLSEGEQDDFGELIPFSGKNSLFFDHSLGISTNRDSDVYAFSEETVIRKARSFIKSYRSALGAYLAAEEPEDIDEFASTIDLKWSRNLKTHLRRLDKPSFDEQFVADCLYRPFTAKKIYNQDILVDESSKTGGYFLGPAKNRIIAVSDKGFRSGFAVLASDRAVDLHLCASADAVQCFPFYAHDKDGSNRRENISSISLQKFRAHYADDEITKWDIFHATYAILHHPEYRTRYAANLKRELPRIPFPSDFRAFSAAGKRLMELHIDYEKQPEYLLEQIEDPKAEVSFRVDRMKLSKDKSELRYNDFLLLRGIPAAAFDYRLGNRSALEWVIDQYSVSTDPRSGIVNDPNRPDDPKYVFRLIGQVIIISLETQRIVAALPSFNFDA